MVFKRKAYDKLLSWKRECNGTKAILVEGARRIGKSTIVEEFATNEYKSYILVDFAKADDNVKIIARYIASYKFKLSVPKFGLRSVMRITSG